MAVTTVWREDRVYLYLSADGVFRERCGRHITLGRNTKPIVVVKHVATTERDCVGCFYERRETEMKGGEGNVKVNEQCGVQSAEL